MTKKKVATSFALKKGLNKEDLLREWEEKSKASIDCGHSVHKVFENFILNKKIKLSGIHQKELVAEKFIKEVFHANRLYPVDAEIVVHNGYLASEIDAIVKNKKGEYFILDWKTNSKIETMSYGKLMLLPFDFLPDASFFHYSLQLNIYEHLCTDFDISKSFIVHIMDNDYEIIKPAKIKIPNQILFGA